MTFINPDNPQNIRTIETFDIIGFSGDVTEDRIYVNFISNDPNNEGQGILEGSLLLRDLGQLKLLRDSFVKAVDDIDAKISK